RRLLVKPRNCVLRTGQTVGRRIPGQEILPVFERIRPLCAQKVCQFNVWRGDKHYLHSGLQCGYSEIESRGRDEGALEHRLLGRVRRSEFSFSVELEVAGNDAYWLGIDSQCEHAVFAKLKR